MDNGLAVAGQRKRGAQKRRAANKPIFDAIAGSKGPHPYPHSPYPLRVKATPTPLRPYHIATVSSMLRCFAAYMLIRSARVPDSPKSLSCAAPRRHGVAQADTAKQD